MATFYDPKTGQPLTVPDDVLHDYVSPEQADTETPAAAEPVEEPRPRRK